MTLHITLYDDTETGQESYIIEVRENRKDDLILAIGKLVDEFKKPSQM